MITDEFINKFASLYRVASEKAFLGTPAAYLFSLAHNLGLDATEGMAHSGFMSAEGRRSVPTHLNIEEKLRVNAIIKEILSILEVQVWKNRFKQYGGKRFVEQLIERNPTFGWPIRVNKDALYAELLKGGFSGYPSDNPLVAFLKKGSTSSLSPFYLEIMIQNLLFNPVFSGIRKVGMHGIPDLVEELREINVPFSSIHLSPFSQLVRDLFVRFRDSVVPTDQAKLQGLFPSYIPLRTFSKIIYESHIIDTKSSFTSRVEWKSQLSYKETFYSLFALMWYIEILTLEDIEIRSDQTLTITDEKYLLDFKENAKLSILELMKKEIYPKAHPELLEITVDIMRLFSESNPNKDALTFREMGMESLREELNMGYTPKKETIDKWIRRFERNFQGNIFLKPLIDRLKLFKLKYKNYLGHAVGTMSHSPLQGENISYFKNRLRTDICTYECGINNPNFPNTHLHDTRMDLIIKRNLGNFKSIENNILGIPDSFSEIAIDFTTLGPEHKSYYHIWEKLNKRYQSDNRFLLIVIYNLDSQSKKDIVKKLNKDINIDHKNVKVITLDEYLDFIGMKSYIEPGTLASNKYLENIRKVDKLGIAAANWKSPSLKAYDELKEFAKHSREYLDSLGLPSHYDDLHLLGQKQLPLKPGNKLP